LAIDAVSAGASAGMSAAVVSGTERPVTFGGRAATVIPPGGEAASDPVPVAASGPLTVTVALPALPPLISEHPVALQTSWLAPRGVAPELGAPMTSWLLLSGVDVLAPRPVHAVVAVGDSITDGVGTVPDANARWTDALATRLAAAGGGAAMAVLNAGISRNELLADGAGGPPPQDRFASDVTSDQALTSPSRAMKSNRSSKVTWTDPVLGKAKRATSRPSGRTTSTVPCSGISASRSRMRCARSSWL